MTGAAEQVSLRPAGLDEQSLICVEDGPFYGAGGVHVETVPLSKESLLTADDFELTDQDAPEEVASTDK